MNILTTLAVVATLATNPNIEYSGRIDFSKPDAPKFSYSGVSIRATVNARQASVVLNDEKGENYYAVIIDQVYQRKLKLKKGKSTYQLADFGEKSVHEVEIVKITEEMFGKTTFIGFDLGAEGEIVEMQNKREHTIEFIGNSITCGYGNEGELGQTFCAETENHYMSYAAITARSLNASPLVVCKSGIGIYRNYAAPTEGSEDCMSNCYDRTFLYEEKPKFDFRQTPDLVCINLGTNDFNTPGVDTARYINRYLDLISQIQTHYTNPDILCLLGPMLEDDALNLARTCIQRVVEAANPKGNGRVSFFEMKPQIKENGLGTDYHPTVKQHITSARQLTEFISELKGWAIEPQILQAKITSKNQITLYANDARCLFSESLVMMQYIVDGQVVKAADWRIDEVGAAMTITLNADINESENIEFKADKSAQKLLRCVISK